MSINPLIGLWGSGLLFALTHSLLAADNVKSKAYQLGLSARGFRLFYVVFATVSTVVWLLYLHGLDDRLLFSVSNPARLINYALQGLAIWLFYLSLKPIDVSVFLGLKSFPKGVEPFIEKGIYKYLRHPMYSAAMLLLFSSPDQSVNSLNLYVLITVYFVIGSKFEEHRLLKTHPEYADYKKRVAAFIPHFKLEKSR